MDSDRINSIIISETHWDRAWYLTFQQFRLKLVKLVDKLLDILESDSAFSHFVFDGQTVVLEDYLEVKPEERARIERLVRAGRIDIGPWYVLPDVFLVSGEALIRNLLRGRRIAEAFGRNMGVGYIPDPFGHVSQLPQILSQFGYGSVIFARGTGDEADELGSEFIWEGTDGSEVLAHWLPLSYGNAANLPEDIDDAVSVLEDTLSRLKPYSRSGVYLLMNGEDHLEPQAHLPRVIAQFNAQNEDQIAIGTLPQFIQLVKQQKKDFARFRGEFRRSKHQNLLSGVYSARVYIKQENERAQRFLERSVEPWSTIAHLVGAKYPADEIRLGWKYLLQNHPHDDICGCSIDAVHEDMMLRFRWIHEIGEALLSSATDSILKGVARPDPGICVLNPQPYSRNGVAIVGLAASDFRYTRLADVHLVDPSLKASTPLEAAKNEVHVAFVRNNGFDMTPIATRTITSEHGTLEELEFDFSSLAMLFPQTRGVLRHLSTRYRIRVNEQNEVVAVYARKFDVEDSEFSSIALKDRNGNQVPVQVLDIEMKRDPKNHLVNDREEYVTLAVAAQDVPGLGVVRYDLEVVEQAEEPNVEGAVACGNNWLENNLVRVDVDPTGTIRLKDKRTGEEYHRLLEFEDTGDIGDEYDYCPDVEPLDIRTGGLETIEPHYSGDLVSSLLLRGTVKIPASVAPDSMSRSRDFVDCGFITEITLKANSPTIEVATAFNNLAEDHRLRVLIPTGTNAEHCSADSTFDVIERPSKVQAHDDWYQPAAPTYPLRSFVSMSGEGRGLTVTTQGLLEFEVLEEQGGTIAVTALRSVGWLSKMGMATRRGAAGPVVEAPEGQCPGIRIFKYAVTPHAGDWFNTGSHVSADEYLNPMRAFFVAADASLAGPYSKSFVTLEPKEAKLSAFKLSEDGKRTVLRFWNIAESDTAVAVRCGFPVKGVVEARADETPLQENRVSLENGVIRMVVPGRQLVTLLLETDKQE
jgi:alpha-mannosidase